MDKETGSLNLGEIEAGLERLMPRGLTDSHREHLESVVDGLAAGASVKPFWGRPKVWQSAAAALLVGALGVALFVNQNSAPNSSLALVQEGPSGENSGIQVLEQVSWIESGSELGVEAFNDEGDISRGYGYAGVEEERILHVSSGYEVILQREFETELYSTSSL